MKDTSMALDDYYELFDISRDADDADIRSTLRAARKRWRPQTGSPDRDRARQAEDRMRQSEDAEQTLLDPAARAAYDAELSAQQSAAVAEPVAGTETVASAGTDWSERAKSYYNAGDVRNAFTAAKKATDLTPGSTLGWLVYVWASTDLKKFDDADFASAELVQRAPDIETSHELRGDVLDAMGRYGEAERAFRTAATLAPSNAYYQSRVAWAKLDQGRVDEAIGDAWELIRRFPDESYPAKVLRAAAEELREKKRPVEALQLMQKLAASRPMEDATMTQLVLAIEAIETSVSVDTALSEAWMLLDAFPDDERAQRVVRYVILSLRSRDRDAEALSAARRLLERQPNDQAVKRVFALSRLSDAESKMTPAGANSHVMLNKAQATYYAEALREVEALDVTDDDVRRAVQQNRSYLAQQTKTRITLSFGRIVLALVALVFFIVGLAAVAQGGFIWLIVAGLLGWWFFAITVKKQYQLTYKNAAPGMRTRGLNR